jgi:hypothetical protein
MKKLFIFKLLFISISLNSYCQSSKVISRSNEIKLKYTELTNLGHELTNKCSTQTATAYADELETFVYKDAVINIEILENDYLYSQFIKKMNEKYSYFVKKYKCF